MKIICIISALLMAIAMHAQGPNTQALGNLTSNVQEPSLTQTKKCQDCEEIKTAIRDSRLGKSKSRSYAAQIKQWCRIISGEMRYKKRRVFSRKYKARPNFTTCFNWH